MGGQSTPATNAAIQAILEMDITTAVDSEARLAAVMESMRRAGAKVPDTQLRAEFDNTTTQRGYGGLLQTKALFEPKLLAAVRTEDTRAKIRSTVANAVSSGPGDDSFSRGIQSALEAKPGQRD
jgi:hypothetical protein